jgi:DNA-directed RNA polymerase subunit RPC12/RpoP
MSTDSFLWELTYMTGVGRRHLKRCPRCGTTMFIEQIIAKFGPLPETHRYRCSDCHCVAEEEIDQDGHPLKFAGLAGWPGARLVN